VEALWEEPDEGIWEVREERRHFTYSKFMCWVAFDRALQAATEFGLPGPLDKWKRLRDRIHKDVCRKGFDKKKDAFTQAYGTEHLDASLLRMPLEGFLPVDDPRIQGTIRAIEEHLINKTFVFRYYPSHEVDGLPGSEGAFILCSFWLVDVYLLAGRSEDAHRLFGELRQLANDVGLLSEEFDPKCKRLIGNFPQALSHTGLIMSAHRLSRKAPLQTRTAKS
jgi:GH15 family glucan-1,4-alpha-glucosidase